MYGFTYNFDAAVTPDYSDLLLYDQITDELRVTQKSTVIGQSIKTTYYKVVTKMAGTRLVEDLRRGLGVYFAYQEMSTSDGFYDIYIAATVTNNICKAREQSDI